MPVPVTAAVVLPCLVGDEDTSSNGSSVGIENINDQGIVRRPVPPDPIPVHVCGGVPGLGIEHDLQGPFPAGDAFSHERWLARIDVPMPKLILGLEIVDQDCLLRERRSNEESEQIR
jgi:hypothetical protein